MSGIVIQGLRTALSGRAPAGAETVSAGSHKQITYFVGDYKVFIQTAANGLGYNTWVYKGEDSVLNLGNEDQWKLTLRGAQRRALRAIHEHSHSR